MMIRKITRQKRLKKERVKVACFSQLKKISKKHHS